MKISVLTVRSFIQHQSQRGPIETAEIHQAFRADTPKQRAKLENIVGHLAGQNMIVRVGTGVRAKNLIGLTA